MTCPVGMLDQFSSYAVCSPNMWMIVACTCMTLLTMILMMYIHHRSRKDMRWLQFAQWKLQQLAERLRYQEPNVTLLEQITRKVNQKKSNDTHAFDFFQNNNHGNNGNNNAGKAGGNATDSAAQTTDLVAAQVKKAREDDAEKVLRDSNIGMVLPEVQTSQAPTSGSQKILKKWTDATKDILAIDDEDKEGKNRVDRTQDD